MIISQNIACDAWWKFFIIYKKKLFRSRGFYIFVLFIPNKRLSA